MNAAVALVGGSLFLLQQFAGINGVLYFSSLTFQDVGITSAALASLYVGLTNFAGSETHSICYFFNMYLAEEMYAILMDMKLIIFTYQSKSKLIL